MNRSNSDCRRYLDPQGELLRALPTCLPEAEALLPLYRSMCLLRQFDSKAVSLQRTGRLGTYASCLGQEAIGVAVGSAMAPQDVLLPSYREHGAQMLRGVSMSELLQFWGGDERGSRFSAGGEDFPVCIPIATQTTQAAGVATAFKLRGESRVAVTVCGDGASSKGDFAEALNLAGVWQLPLVVVLNNNQWAISVPRDRQSAAPRLADKAAFGGIAGLQVDGNDVIAVYAALAEALDRARRGGGATLIECLSYRLCDHTTADDASRYRSEDELREAWRREPLERLRRYLASSGLWDERREEAWLADCRAQVETATETYLSMPPQAPESIFEHLYAELPEALREQRDSLTVPPGGHGG